MLIYGINPVLEALRAKTVKRLRVSARSDKRMDEVLALAGAVGKASAGALARVRIATVVNIARAVEALKAANVWTVGLAGDAGEPYTDVDWTLASALVLGAEGTGLRRLVRETCDRVVNIPMLGTGDSLNVSVAAGGGLYEAVRQHRNHLWGQDRR